MTQKLRYYWSAKAHLIQERYTARVGAYTLIVERREDTWDSYAAPLFDKRYVITQGCDNFYNAASCAEHWFDTQAPKVWWLLYQAWHYTSLAVLVPLGWITVSMLFWGMMLFPLSFLHAVGLPLMDNPWVLGISAALAGLVGMWHVIRFARTGEM